MSYDIKLPINYRESSWQNRRLAREQYVKEQKGMCWYCKKPLNEKPLKSILDAYINKSLFPETFFNYEIHLHHNHRSGKTIGAVHSRCNAYLWQYNGE